MKVEGFRCVQYTYCMAENFRMVQNLVFFVDRSVSAKIAATAISIVPRLSVCAGAAKIKTRKFLQIPSEAIPRNFAPTKISRYTVWK